MTNETLLISINLNTQNTKITKGSLYSRTPPMLSRYELVGIYIQSLPVSQGGAGMVLLIRIAKPNGRSINH